ncbi:retrovirus-related Pol polyprotein from transposon 412 [Trichonephila clavata]|uniref:Retrovirus-related Pol polyprotein from transposon 412 n=1 Tax=Trichonephila clavata TaxID=2740835 RepID=A0A8X6K5D9_TRICU|nr:retrovirus-related Pol polyprotein from transposon 412 [Trichonephila clavata]
MGPGYSPNGPPMNDMGVPPPGPGPRSGMHAPLPPHDRMEDKYGMEAKRRLGRSFEEHLSNIRRVLQKLKEANLKLSPSKCHLFRREVAYLGHIISAEGVRTDPDKISAVKNWKSPMDVHQLRSFLGLYASHESIGAVLSQEIDGQERVIAYFSKCLSRPERNLLCDQEGTACYRKSRGALPSLPLRSTVPTSNRSCIIDLATEF